MNLTILLALIACSAMPLRCGDWNMRASAEYLDSRQKAWFEWKAGAPGGHCVSCHTGLSYLQARPALERAIGEKAPTQYRTGLLAGMRARLQKQESGGMFPTLVKEPLASQASAVEAVIAALVL